MLLIQALRDELLKPLQSVTGIIERKHTLPILSNVLIENKDGNIKFIGTDLEIQIITDGPVTNCGNFSVTTNARKLQDILRAIPENLLVSLELHDSQLILKTGKGKYNLQTLPARDFPLISINEQIKACFSIKQADFHRMLSQVQYSMAVQDIRFYLNGLLIQVNKNRLNLVATDGHRLALTSTQIDTDFDLYEVIVPRKTVLELFKVMNFPDSIITVEFLEEQIRFRCNNTIIISKIVDGKFPDYNKVIPLDNNIFVPILKNELLGALERVSVLANEKLRGVRLFIKPGILTVICNNIEQEEAQENIEIAYKGDSIEIGYNIAYIMDMLRNIVSEEIQLALSDSNKSTLFSIPNNEDFKYIVMPMRI